MIGTNVDWVLVVVADSLPQGATLQTLPPFRGPDYKVGYPSEADAFKRVDQLERICRVRWGTTPRFNVVRRERRVKRVPRDRL